MPRSSLIKSVFTSGVLDPRLKSRVDIVHYEKGLQQGMNTVVTPFGGVTRRGGLRRIDKVTNETAYNTRLIPFSYNSSNVQYAVALCVIDVATVKTTVAKFYRNDVLITNINGTGVPYLVVPWPHTVYPTLRYAQTADVMILTHPDYAPRRLARGRNLTIVGVDVGTDYLTTGVNHGLTLYQEVYFSNSASPPTLPPPLVGGVTYYVRSPTATTFQVSTTIGGAAINLTGVGAGTTTAHVQSDNQWTLDTPLFVNIPQYDYNDGRSPASTACVQTITITAGAVVGANYKLDMEGVLTESITWAGDATAADQESNKQRIAAALSKLYNTGSGEITVARTGALVYTVTFSGGSARDYKVMTGFATSGLIVLSIALTTSGVPRTEDIWSATRGYPVTVCFWEQRLVFGGLKSKPQTVVMSVTQDPYNFSTGQGEDDDAILRTLDTDQLNAIVGMVPGQHLQVFTEGAEFYFPDQPVTPAASGVTPQTRYGCNTVHPVQLDGATLFFEENGRGLRQFLYSQLEQAYQGPSASRLSSFLLKTPVDMASLQSSVDSAASNLFVVNADGSLALMVSERSEEIVAWTPWTTKGLFKNVCVLTEAVYFLVRYPAGTGAGEERTNLVKLDPDYYTDDGRKFTGASSVTWSIGTELDGATCKARGDNAVVPDEIPAAGVVTLATAVTSLEVGLGFTVTVQPMPVALISNRFALLNKRARIAKVYAQILSTLGLKCENYPMDKKYLPVVPLSTDPAAVSGVVEWGLRGWDDTIAPVFVQEDPSPLTILSLEYDVEMH